MSMIMWLEFLLTFSILMLAARKSLWLALFLSALFLGLLSVPFPELSVIVSNTLLDPSVLLLAVSVGLIAILGGSMEMTGLIDDLMSNTSLRRRPALIVLPGLLGMLPIPGGALLSAPIVARAAPDAEKGTKASVNVWSRHLAVLFYPLGTLLATTKMAGLDLYTEILYLSPGLILTIVMIWIFFLGKVEDGRISGGERKRMKAFVPVSVILTAPIIHVSLMYLFPGIIPELFLLIGVSSALVLVLVVKGEGAAHVILSARRMRAQNFVLIILGMFVFLEVFNASDVPEVIRSLPLSRPLLIVFAGSVLGAVTGRVNVPVSVMLPVLGASTMDYTTFSILFFSIFIGYLVSPVHPCVSVSLEYFRTDYSSMLRSSALPALVMLAAVLVVSLILL